MAEQIILITAAQTRNYGKVQQTFSAEMTVVVESSDQRQAAYKNLNILIAQEFAAFEQNYLPSPPQNHAGNDQKAWAGGTLQRNVENGVERYKLVTGEFTKYGVPVYPEVIDQFPAMDDGQYSVNLEGYGGHILVVNGKPKKVLSCRQVPS